MPFPPFYNVYFIIFSERISDTGKLLANGTTFSEGGIIYKMDFAFALG